MHRDFDIHAYRNPFPTHALVVALHFVSVLLAIVVTAISATRYRHLIARREDTDTCLIKPAIQVPSGVAFSLGSASISFFLGRYATLVLNKGGKGGLGGTNNHVRRNYFPVVEVVEGDSER